MRVQVIMVKMTAIGNLLSNTNLPFGFNPQRPARYKHVSHGDLPILYSAKRMPTG